MHPELATITAKGQVILPKAIREALSLRQGDQLRWDLTYLRGVEAGLQEKASPEDGEPFAEL